jgi:acetyl esterase/lipase
MGDSAGGHLAGALGTCSSPDFDDPHDDLKISSVPNAIIMCNPITDMLEGTWSKFVLRGDWLKKKNVTPADLVLTADETDLAKSLSPVDCIKAGEPPVLLMHGTDDHIVNPKQAQDFADAYNKAGNHCELVWMQGQGHAFVLPKYRAPESVVVEAITRADGFLGQQGFWTSKPTLEVSNPPAWIPKPSNQPKPTITPTPAAH